MLKFLRMLTMVATLAVGYANAQTPGSVLSQLGARGVAISGGNTNYRGFLILLDSQGRIDSSLIPTESVSPTVVPLTATYYIDTNGTNLPNAGSIAYPFKTLEYALSQLTTNAVLIFSPGEYAKATTAITNTSVSKLVIRGHSPETTSIEGSGGASFTFANSTSSEIDIAGITIERINQQNNVLTTIRGYDRGVLNNFGRTYTTNTNSHVTVYMDPSAVMPIITNNATLIHTHSASNMLYTPSDSSRWASIPTTIQAGLDILSEYSAIPEPSYPGAIIFWGGSNWVSITGSVDSVLFGGVSPTFNMLTLVGDVTGPYSNTVVADDVITTNKFTSSLRNTISSMLTTNTDLSGDTTGTYNNVVVVGLHGVPLDPPADTNDMYMIVYDHGNGIYTYRPAVIAGEVTNWSKYIVLTNVNLDNHGFTNVSEMTLGGERRTNWPVATGGDTWSAYSATNNVNINNFLLQGVRGITLGGILRTNWPTPTNWSSFNALTDVDMNNKGFTGVQYMELGGVIRYVWPDVAVFTNIISIDGSVDVTYPADRVELSVTNYVESVFSTYIPTNSSLIKYMGTNSYGEVEFSGAGVSSTATGFEFFGGTISRYSASAAAGEEIYVVASRSGVTASRLGTTITFDIPTGTVLFSARVRWDGTLGSSLTLNMGTTDMLNTGLADRWNALFSATREDTGALIAGAACRLDPSNHDQLIIQGLWTGGINHLRLSF